MALENAMVFVFQKGKKTEHFIANLPQIRTLKGLVSSVVNFEIYNHLFKKNNKLSDVDGSMEQNGHTLHFEFKGARNGMNRGQVLKAIRQAKFSNITTLFIFGKPETPEGYAIIKPCRNKDGFDWVEYTETDYNGLCNVISQWVEYTEKNNLVKNRTAEWNATTNFLGSLYKKQPE